MKTGFLIWSAAAVIFLVLGKVSWKSKKPVSFFTFVKPPVVKDVKKYNHAVAILWFVSTILFEILGIPLLFIRQNSPWGIALMLGTMFWGIGISVVYIRIEEKYKK